MCIHHITKYETKLLSHDLLYHISFSSERQMDYHCVFTGNFNWKVYNSNSVSPCISWFVDEFCLLRLCYYLLIDWQRV